MVVINNETLYKDKLDRLWDSIQNSYKEMKERGYAIEREVIKESILFISMNPSFSKDAWNNGNSNGSIFYDIPNDPKKETNPFFVAINAFYGELAVPKPPLAHHDLLFIRETNQKSVLSCRKDSQLNGFYNGQLDISKEIIINSKPVLIVVLNAGARKLFEQLFKDSQCEPPYNEDLGAYIYRIGKNETPVLFSGMLSGQRALDLGSKRSLKWHIECILKHL